MSDTTTPTTVYTLHLTCEDGGTDSIAVEPNRKMADVAREWVHEGSWGDDGAIVSCHWTLEDEDGDELDSGTVTVEIEPDHDALIAAAGGDVDCEHDWTSEGEGGCDSNPGVWSTGGTSFTFASHCRTCGLHRTEYTCGSQRNPGEHDTVSYEQPSSWCATCERVDCTCEQSDEDESDSCPHCGEDHEEGDGPEGYSCS